MKEKTYADRQLRLIRRNQIIGLSIMLSILLTLIKLPWWLSTLPLFYGIYEYVQVKRYYRYLECKPKPDYVTHKCIMNGCVVITHLSHMGECDSKYFKNHIKANEEEQRRIKLIKEGKYGS